MDKCKLSIEFVRASFEKEGYILLTKTYENSRQKLEYICKRGHRHRIDWHHWNSKKKCKCPYCANNIKLNIEFIRKEFAKEDYELLTKIYDNAHQKLEYICPIGHRHNINWNHWQQGNRCPACPSKVSKWELEVKKYVKSLNVSFLSNSRDVLINPNTNCNLELDIWFPELNKAIECNGRYWHSTEKASERDKVKLVLCQQKNINLLVLDDIEWAKNKQFCQHKIKNFITIKNTVTHKII